MPGGLQTFCSSPQVARSPVSATNGGKAKIQKTHVSFLDFFHCCFMRFIFLIYHVVMDVFVCVMWFFTIVSLFWIVLKSFCV